MGTEIGQIEQFWQRYRKTIATFGVAKTQQPRYRAHVERFIAEHSTVRLPAHTPDSVRPWLEGRALSEANTPWRYRQQVDALRLLFKQMLRLDWAAALDWNGTFAALSEATHISFGTVPNGGRFAKEHPTPFEAFLAATRIPDDSYKCGQSYLGWINRLLTFHAQKPVDGLGPADVRSFLEHLAVQRNVASSTQAQALNAIAFLFRRCLNARWVMSARFAARRSRNVCPQCFRVARYMRCWKARMVCPD